MYSPKEYATWQKEALALLANVEPVQFDGPVDVTVEVFGTRPKSSKLLAPKADVDNFAKGVLDVITHDGRFWNDDTQVLDLTIRKRWGAPDAQGNIKVTIRELAV